MRWAEIINPMDRDEGDYKNIGRVRRDLDRGRFGTKLELQRSRLVARDKIGQVVVSTIEMSRDVSNRTGPPRRFQTLVMGGKFHMFKTYSFTLEEAQKRHAEVTEKIKLIEEFDLGPNVSTKYLKNDVSEQSE